MFIIVLASLTIRTISISLFLPNRVVSFVPDDALYYIGLAKNRVSTGNWTFDGTAPATGFHLLWGYILWYIYSLANNISFETVFYISAILDAICIAAAAALLAHIVVSRLGEGAIFGILILFFNPIVIQQSTSMMEAPLAILCAAAMLFCVFESKRSESPHFLLGVACIGFLGILARSDFGLLPVALFIVTVLAHSRSWWTEKRALTAGVGLMGSILGLGLVSAHNYVLAGHWVQASALVKRHWSITNGDSILPILRIVVALCVPYVKLLPSNNDYLRLLEIVPVGVALSVCVWNYRTAIRAQVLEWGVIGVSAILTICADICLNTFNSVGVQVWYCAHLVAPLSLILAIAIWPVGQTHFYKVAATTLMCMGIGLYASIRPTWPWQQGMREAGLYLRANPQIGSVAGWNVGYVSYFSGRPIINLDGLVNDDVLSAIESDALAAYIKSRNIEYILDFPVMLTESLARRGGYGDGKLVSCLELQGQLADDSQANRFYGAAISLYKVNQRCLATVVGIQ